MSLLKRLPFRDTTSFEEPVWVFIESCYLYMDSSLVKLLWIIITEWRADRHLAG